MGTPGEIDGVVSVAWFHKYILSFFLSFYLFFFNRPTFIFLSITKDGVDLISFLLPVWPLGARYGHLLLGLVLGWFIMSLLLNLRQTRGRAKRPTGREEGEGALVALMARVARVARVALKVDWRGRGGGRWAGVIFPPSILFRNDEDNWQRRLLLLLHTPDVSPPHIVSEKRGRGAG